MFKNILYTFLFYILAFGILYLEPMSISGVNFGVLWKLLLIAFLITAVYRKILVNNKLNLFILAYILLSFKILFSYSSFDYPILAISDFIKTLLFPALYLFFVYKVKEKTLLFIARNFSIVIILSFIPYILGILTPMGEGYDLGAYGLKGLSGLVGPFINPHSASISIAFSLILITTLVKKDNSKTKNIIYMFIIFLGLYELINTYVRTGIVVYIIALGYLSFRNLTFKKIILASSVAIVLASGTLYLYQTNDIVKMRFEDRNKYNESSAGSGRFTFWANAIENWHTDELTVIFIGLGKGYAKEKMNDDIGQALFAHNEYIQILQQEGLIGVFLLITFLISMKIYISKYKTSKYYVTTMALFIGYLVEMMFQGGFYFIITLLLTIYLSLLKQERKELS